MSDYLNYEDYMTLGGTLELPEFNRYAFRAENAINFRTFDRIQKLDLAEQSEKFLYALHMTMFELINLYMSLDSYMGLVKSETPYADGNNIPAVRLLGQSNDGVTVTYNVAAAKDAMAGINYQIESAIQNGLNGITTSLGKKLLWRGIYPDE